MQCAWPRWREHPWRRHSRRSSLSPWHFPFFTGMKAPVAPVDCMARVGTGAGSARAGNVSSRNEDNTTKIKRKRFVMVPPDTARLLLIRTLGPLRLAKQKPAEIGGLPNVSVQVHAATNNENSGDRHAFWVIFLTARNRP